MSKLLSRRTALTSTIGLIAAPCWLAPRIHREPLPPCVRR